MALTDLAKFNTKDPVTLRDISLRQGISLVYLEQLFSKLKKNKIVKSIRGNKGGYVLNKNASEVKISDILLAVDEKIKTIGCKKHSEQGCNGRSSKCNTHDFRIGLVKAKRKYKYSHLTVDTNAEFIEAENIFDNLLHRLPT